MCITGKVAAAVTAAKVLCMFATMILEVFHPHANVQALCNLALEAAAGTPEALSACPPPPAPSPTWHLIYENLPGLVPSLIRLISSPPGSPPPDASAVLPAAQTLANLMRGAAFVPRLLPLLGLLPELVGNLAPHPGAELRQQVAQMLLNAALHRGLATALDAAEAPKVGPGLLMLQQLSVQSNLERTPAT